MKKLVLTTVCAMAVTGAAFAAGNLSWASIPFGSMTAQTNSTQNSPFFGGAAVSGGAVGATGIAATGYYYELLYTTYSGSQATIPTLAALLSWQDTGLGANNSASAGRLAVMPNNTLSGLPAGAGASVPWSPGTTDSIVLVGWSADLGTTWLSVSNTLNGGSSAIQAVLAGQQGFLGVSATGYTTTFTTATSPGATVFAAGATSEGLPIFSTLTQLYLLPVPEPASMALLGLGGLSLMLFRRQRKS
jgi:hypothetical protein